ncbi:MAG: type II secretion system F family protein [Candidatus Micrarchaeia archaeon]
MIFSNLLKNLEDRVPMYIKKKIQKLLLYAGEEEAPESWFIKNLIVSLLFGLAFLSAPTIFFSYLSEAGLNLTETRFLILSFIIGLTAFIVYWIFVFSALYLKIEYRKRRTNEILPDFLSSVAMNIRAGMEPISALYVSLRPDFDPITSEMMKIRSLAIGSKSILDQLSYLTSKIDSNALRRTVAIIDRASRSGGELGRLLLSVADDLRDTNRVQKELETSTRGYVYFISFLTILGIPLLLSVSSVFISATAKQSQQFTGGFGGLISVIPISNVVTSQTLDPSAVLTIFIILISIGAISASLMLGVLWHGEVKQGFRYSIILLPLAIIAFLIFRSAMFSLIASFGI